MAEAAQRNAIADLFGEVWSTTKTVGTEILRQEGAQALARYQTRNQIAEQSPYTDLAQQSPNLGPNVVVPAERAAVEQTRDMQGSRSIAQAFSANATTIWIVAAIAVVAVVFLFRRK